ncbi:Asp-tRNA(Asn)/Glu-tRNA(Gln) amidotransferase subunit GatA, partial [Cytophagia bacterium CHB2]|nr:Asp-tRNA(Asn)/Glu-tRNA(Gln) amidotransferase subunit GatA [Cytophagia bacterium CHB2]
MSHFANIRSTQEKLRRGEQTCAALVEAHLERIAAAAPLNAFITVLDQRARAQAMLD